jgi:hypothetical protein
MGQRRIAGAGVLLQHLHHARLFLAEAGGAQAVADDLGAGEELIAPAVVAVVVRVDHPARRPFPDPRVLLHQGAGLRQVPEGVDDHAAAAIDQPRVAPAQAAVRLQAGIHVRGELVQLHG